MLGLSKKKGPTRPFSHAQDCKIVKADPGVEIPWQEIETGHWVAECQCGMEHHHEAPAVPLLLADPVSTFQPGEWRSKNLAVLVREMDVMPIKESWQEDLGDSLARFETFRSWTGSRMPEDSD